MPILDRNSTEYISHSADQTRRAGMRLGALLKKGDTICLVGELGSGKTTFAQGLSTGWGSLDQASSPTFVLVNVYRRPNGDQLYHLDAYRLRDAWEAENLDIDAMLVAGPLIVEWADRIQEALPKDHLWIQLRWIDDNQRDLIFSAKGSRSRQLLSSLQQRIFGVV